MKILVTGGAGFIGSRICKLYLDTGHEVVVVDDLSRGKSEDLPQGVRLHTVDITDQGALGEVFDREKPAIVNHQAALVNVRESALFPDRYCQVNLEGTRNVLRLAISSSVRKLIFASSGGAVYGEAQSLPVAEDHPLKPLSAYGETKMLAERMILGQAGKITTIILRYGNVYGVGQDPSYGSGAVAIFAHNLMVGKPITLFGNGEQLRDYVHVCDVARANLLALERDQSGVYNIGTGQGHTLMEVLERVSTALGIDPELIVHPAHPFEVWRIVLENSRAREHLGWQAKVGFAHGVDRVAAKLTANSDQLAANN